MGHFLSPLLLTLRYTGISYLRKAVQAIYPPLLDLKETTDSSVGTSYRFIFRPKRFPLPTLPQE